MYIYLLLYVKYLFRFNPLPPSQCHSITAGQAATLKKLSVFHGLRNYLSISFRSLILFLIFGLIYRSSFNAYRRPSASSITPSLEPGSSLVFFFSFCFNYARKRIKCKDRSSGVGGRGGPALGIPSPFARFRAGSKMRRPGRVVKRAFVVNMFYVRFLLYWSFSARVKCQKISDSLIMRARSLDL